MDSYLQKARQEIEEATSGISAEQLSWHPEGKWCSAEVLEHLSLAFAGTAKGMRRALTADAIPPLKRTVKNRVLAFVVADIGYMPTGRKAPPGTIPRGANGGDPVGEILRNLEEMDAALAEVERTKGPRTTFNHPVLGPLTLPQWRKFHFVHTRHHMQQVRKLRELAS